MNISFVNRQSVVVALLMLICMPVPALAQNQGKDTTSIHLLNEVRKYFNSDNEGAFYIAAEKYRDYYLKTGNTHLYYKGWEHEILYDVNHNHFYRAMRKTTSMYNDMKRRKAEDEYYSATHLRGIIYSLRGNITLAHQYFEKALEEVDHSQPINLINIYFDLANIEMDTQPQEAMKHLDCAIDIIKANNGKYEYSDAIGFKVIVAYAMRDWDTVRRTYQEYVKLKESLGNDFSTTYYQYAKICKNVADHHYGEAIRLTNLLTNTTDQYKFQTEIYEIAGDTINAFKAQKRYLAVKDSVNNVIMSEEMVGSANDLALAEMKNEECSKRSDRMKWSFLALIPIAFLMPVAACQCHKRKYTKKLQQQNQELKITRDKAQEAERMKANFIQNMSHEIRTPLNIISGFAQVISEPHANISEEERAQIATRIANSTNSIVNIINEILDISGKESIHYIDKSDFISCNELAIKILQPFEINEKGHYFRFESKLKDSYKIKTNVQEVEKILNNLLNNACKFTEQGTIKLSCYHDEVEDGMVCFSVTDTGKGIKEGEEEKIFEHFYKVDAYKEGVGLGLPLARRVARQMGGDVILDTSYKEGSRFILKLPKE
jgi:signal transduction histidine kinase